VFRMILTSNTDFSPLLVYRTNRLSFIMETGYVFYAVGTEFLFIIQINTSLETFYYFFRLFRINKENRL